MNEIIWTKTDEAPLISSYSLLPILSRFLGYADIKFKLLDISLAGRILANFGLKEDALKILGELTQKEYANIIKLPNISATLPQLNAAINELCAKGYDVPLYEDAPEKYAHVLGSAVNPVLRQGNSDRRSVRAVKEYARANPHSNGIWDENVKTRVAYMQSGDFYDNERSFTCKKDGRLTVKFIDKNKNETVLKEFEVLRGEIIDASFMSVDELCKFYARCFNEAKREALLVSLHLKATMMKVSDPVIFGYALSVYFAEIFKKYSSELASIGALAKNGLRDIFEKISNLKEPLRGEILAKFDEISANSAQIAMINVKEGITNFHVPNDVIIDASMPSLLRNSGKMPDKNGAMKEALAIIPDSTYATLYEAAIKNFKTHGAPDPKTLGSVSNVGLMAKKAEEYGSHDKTFIAQDEGKFIVCDEGGAEIFKFELKKGDIFRMTQTKDDAVQSWLKLAISRAKDTNDELIFWLDEKRAHDREILAKFSEREAEFKDEGIKYGILNYAQACERSLNLIREGKNVISVTGNVLRDYLTDLFPIIELASSAKMLSIVPLLNGGGLFETGAGGTAPGLARELISQNHLSWDSLGEFLALIASLERYAKQAVQPKAQTLARTLELAVSSYLAKNRSPKTAVGEADTRASHFYLALYWAQELTKSELKEEFSPMASELWKNEMKILDELNKAQGRAVDLGGYFLLDDVLADKIMRPSPTLNKIIGEVE